MSANDATGVGRRDRLSTTVPSSACPRRIDGQASQIVMIEYYESAKCQRSDRTPPHSSIRKPLYREIHGGGLVHQNGQAASQSCAKPRLQVSWCCCVRCDRRRLWGVGAEGRALFAGSSSVDYRRFLAAENSLNRLAHCGNSGSSASAHHMTGARVAFVSGAQRPRGSRSRKAMN
jgi:hypothetical protein